MASQKSPLTDLDRILMGKGAYASLSRRVASEKRENSKSKSAKKSRPTRSRTKD